MAHLRWMVVPVLLAASVVPSKPIAQSSPGSAVDAVRAAFTAMDEHDWTSAAELTEVEFAAALKAKVAGQLALAGDSGAVAEQVRRTGQFQTGASIDSAVRVRLERARTEASNLLQRYSVGDAAAFGALSEGEVLARWFEAQDPTTQLRSFVRQLPDSSRAGEIARRAGPRLHRTVIGAVMEADTLAQVVFREEMFLPRPGSSAASSTPFLSSVRVVSVRRHGHGWYLVDPAQIFGIGSTARL